MKRLGVILILTAFGLFAEADTTLVFGFDNNTEPNGIQYNTAEQSITFSGAVSSAGQTDFNVLDNVDGTVTFSIGAVGDLLSFSGTVASVGGSFAVGASGGGLNSVGDGSYLFDDPSEGWVFTFSHDIYLTDMNYYAPDAGQQTVAVNSVEVPGSPFDDDFAGEHIFVQAGDSLTFGYDGSGTGTYGLDDFTITVVPEPVAVSMTGIGGLILLAVRRMFRG